MKKGALTLEVLGGPPGAGKSHLNTEQAAGDPGIYAFVFPSIALLEEQTSALRKAGLTVAKVHSRAASGNVQSQLGRAVERFRERGVRHGAYAITHSGLIASDFAALPDVHWRIDEAIELHRGGKITVTEADLDFWRTRFLLTDASNGWSRVTPVGRAVSLYDRAQGLLGQYSAFSTSAQKGIVFLAAEKWALGKLDWFSLWSPLSLPSPASLRISGAGFERSVSAHLLRILYPEEIEIVTRALPSRRTQQPTVRVRYFSEWEATSEHWGTRCGREHLKAIATHIRGAQPDLGYWSGNEEAVKCLDHHIHGGEAVAPKLAGLNRLQSARSCAFIYSAKATREDDVLIRVMGMTREQIRAAREDEDIFQFSYRGAIRRPEYGGAYDVFLFSRQQAERLRTSLLESGLSDVTILKEDLGPRELDQPLPTPKGRKKKRPDETREERRSRRTAERRRQRGNPEPSTEAH